MEIPALVTVYNASLPWPEKKGRGVLVAVADGYYEVHLEVQQRRHTVLLPMAETVIFFNEPLTPTSSEFEIER